MKTICWVSFWGFGFSLVLLLLLTCSVAFASPPVALITPKGLVAHAAPTLRWTPVPGVTQYLLHVDQGSTPVHRQWITAGQARCTDECKFILPVDLAPGDYVWMLSYRTVTGYGPWSTATQFSVKIMTLEQGMRSCFIQFIECKAIRSPP